MRRLLATTTAVLLAATLLHATPAAAGQGDASGSGDVYTRNSQGAAPACTRTWEVVGTRPESYLYAWGEDGPIYRTRQVPEYGWVTRCRPAPPPPPPPPPPPSCYYDSRPGTIPANNEAMIGIGIGMLIEGLVRDCAN